METKDICFHISIKISRKTSLDRCASKHNVFSNKRCWCMRVTLSVRLCDGHRSRRKKKPHNRVRYTSVFDIPASFHLQTTPSVNRDVQQRAVDSECCAERKRQILSEKDKILDWAKLKEYCNKLTEIMVRETDSMIELLKLDSFPPQVSLSVFINSDFKVTTFRKHIQIKLRDVVHSFTHKLERYSEQDMIITKVSKYQIPVTVLEKCSGKIVEIMHHEDISSSQKHKLDSIMAAFCTVFKSNRSLLLCPNCICS